MIVKCHFCMKRDYVKRIPGPMGRYGPVFFDLCEECAAEKEACEARSDNLMDLQHNNPSNLCVGCGICCFILHARVTNEEADAIVAENGIKFEDFAEKTPVGELLYPGAYTIKTPCMFLLGHPLSRWTACKIHDKIRPEVCRSYLCKIAIRYQLGTISLNEARYWLRTAIVSKDLSIFNWIKDDAEVKIMLSSAVASQIGQLREQNMPDEQIKMAIASLVTPRYEAKSELDALALDMHFATFDRGDFDPKVFFTDEELSDGELSKFSPYQLVERTIQRVVATFRGYVKKESRSPIDKVVTVIEERVEELRVKQLAAEAEAEEES